jgi:hypothetical protein
MNNEFRSRQIYPELKMSVYTIEFFLPEEAYVTLSILSQHGKIIEQVIENVKFGSGRHKIEFDRAKCNGDLCFYRLSMQTGRQEIVDTKRIFSKTESLQ